MKHYKTRQDDQMLAEAYDSIINEGSMPFDPAKFTDALKNAARFIQGGELSTLGTGGLEAVMSRFHMDRAAKKQAMEIFMQQHSQLFPGVSEASLDRVASIIQHNQGEDTGDNTPARKYGMGLSSKPTVDDYSHTPGASSSQYKPNPPDFYQ